VGLLLRFAAVTDHLYHALVKDPERVIPEGRVIVAPADGIVLYVRKIEAGMIPQVVKKGVAVPVAGHLKTDIAPPIEHGWLIGIYMNTHGVHINRIPNHGVVKQRTVFNGPHMSMTETERTVILTQLIPGLTALKKRFGMAPYNIEDKADYVLKSARETLMLEDERGARLFVVRIADYDVGKILTWVREGDRVERGRKMGMITWGSQVDLLIEATPDTSILADVGDYVYGGETALAAY
jgi:phosphatidylserine decarboxylase